MSGIYYGFIILAVIGIPVLIWAGVRTFRQRRQPPSHHPGRPDHIHCPSCGHKNAGNAMHCEQCGRALHPGAPGR